MIFWKSVSYYHLELTWCWLWYDGWPGGLSDREGNVEWQNELFVKLNKFVNRLLTNIEEFRVSIYLAPFGAKSEKGLISC